MVPEVLLGEKPSARPERIDAEFFKQMARLYIYRKGITQEDFYREVLEKLGIGKHVTYKIIHEETKTVEKGLEDFMKENFSGLSESELEIEIKKLEKRDLDRRFYYDEFNNDMEFLKESLGVGWRPVLGMGKYLFESLKRDSISAKKRQYISKLVRRTKRALKSDSYDKLQKIRDEIYGKELRGRVDYRTLSPFLDCLEACGIGVAKLLGKKGRPYYERSPATRTIPKEKYENIVRALNDYVLKSFEESEEKRVLVSNILLEHGLSKSKLESEIKKFEEEHLAEERRRVPFDDKKKKDVGFLVEKLDIHYGRLVSSLEQKTVTKKRANYISELCERTDRALESGSYSELDKIRDEVYGRKPGRKHSKTKLPRISRKTSPKGKYEIIVETFYKHVLAFLEESEEKRKSMSNILLKYILEPKEKEEKNLPQYNPKGKNEFNAGTVIYHKHHKVDDIGVVLSRENNRLYIYFKKTGLGLFSANPNNHSNHFTSSK